MSFEKEEYENLGQLGKPRAYIFIKVAHDILLHRVI